MEEATGIELQSRLRALRPLLLGSPGHYLKFFDDFLQHGEFALALDDKRVEKIETRKLL